MSAAERQIGTALETGRTCGRTCGRTDGRTNRTTFVMCSEIATQRWNRQEVASKAGRRRDGEMSAFVRFFASEEPDIMIAAVNCCLHLASGLLPSTFSPACARTSADALGRQLHAEFGPAPESIRIHAHGRAAGAGPVLPAGRPPLAGELAGAAGAIVAILLAAPSTRCRSTWRACRSSTASAFGLLPVGWTVFNAMLLYNITVETGQFDVIRRSVAGLSGDARMQAILIGFAFGASWKGRPAAARRWPSAGRCWSASASIRSWRRSSA